MKRETALWGAFEKLITGPGQGSVFEKIDKLVREQQRGELYKMLEKIRGEDDFPVALYTNIEQVGRKTPARLRYYLPKWAWHDEVFWRALGDYIILALHSVTDIEYDRRRGMTKIDYFATENEKKSPEEIREIIKGLACLIDREVLPTDFTRVRRMAERRGSLGEMSKEEAAALFGAAGVVIKLASSFI